MPLPQLAEHPQAVGMYLGGDAITYPAGHYWPVYQDEWQAVIVYPGRALVPSFLGDIDVSTVDTIAAARKAVFDHDQLHSSFHPMLQADIGFVSDAQGITLYSQYQLPGSPAGPITDLTFTYVPDRRDPLTPLVPYTPAGDRPSWPMPAPKRVGSPDFPPAPGTSPKPGSYPFR